MECLLYAGPLAGLQNPLLIIITKGTSKEKHKKEQEKAVTNSLNCCVWLAFEQTVPGIETIDLGDP